MIETERLILRPWVESDAENLYELAKDPLIGPIAGWPVHTSVENSRDIINGILSADNTYAIVLKGTTNAIGSIGLMIGKQSNIAISNDEAEIGYWIGVPYWGNGYVPEAVNELIRYAFIDLGIQTIWCGYFEGNEKSKRVQEKCGFIYHHTLKDKEWPLINAVCTEHITCINRQNWKESK